jgi:hypothetical protein
MFTENGFITLNIFPTKTGIKDIVSSYNEN